MLVIKHKHQLDVPRMTFNLPRTMEFEPVPADNELDVASYEEIVREENDWQLTERPDTAKLEQFWGSIVSDAHNDPDWTSYPSD